MSFKIPEVLPDKFGYRDYSAVISALTKHYHFPTTYKFRIWKYQSLYRKELFYLKSQYGDPEYLMERYEASLSKWSRLDTLAFEDLEHDQEGHYETQLEYSTGLSLPVPFVPHVSDKITGNFDPRGLGLSRVEWLMQRKRDVYAKKMISERDFIYEMRELAKLRKKAIVNNWK